jgi:hypothetical protein
MKRGSGKGMNVSGSWKVARMKEQMFEKSVISLIFIVKKGGLVNHYFLSAKITFFF